MQILGQRFTGTTSVSFNGTPALFKVCADTFLVAKVPAGATTGNITVTEPSGTFTSNKIFRVMPDTSGFSPINGPVGRLSPSGKPSRKPRPSALMGCRQPASGRSRTWRCRPPCPPW